MSMSTRARELQGELWIATTELAHSPGHPFYERLSTILAEVGFDSFVEEKCRRFYAEGKGRPSIPPSVYIRMLLIGYFEGLDSERGIAWRCADSLSLRRFLGFGLNTATPDHSSLSRIRQRLDLETHQEIFTLVLKILAKKGLLKGKTIGVDATTLEANAALRSIVRRDDGSTYNEYLEGLAKASGIETPQREDLARIDKKRPKKGSNDDWVHPHDPDAKITKMKDGRTHLAHKAEHAVDMDSGAIIGATVQDATIGDPSTMKQTMVAAVENVLAVHQDEECSEQLSPSALKEWVADKGYHSNATMEMADQVGLRTYVSEPKRGRRRWKGKASARRGTYANRRRIGSDRGKRLMRRRGELVERSFAHCLETGRMRRTHLRGRENIAKRYLVHVAAFNLGLVMRSNLGYGTPRGLAGRLAALAAQIAGVIKLIYDRISALAEFGVHSQQPFPKSRIQKAAAQEGASSTGC